MTSSVDKKQINVRLEEELFDFITKYAKDNYMTVTGLFKKIVIDLYKEEKKKNMN
jgi:hypothetical protein